MPPPKEGTLAVARCGIYGLFSAGRAIAAVREAAAEAPMPPPLPPRQEDTDIWRRRSCCHTPMLYAASCRYCR
jgi:hypothetical protein